MRQPRHSSVTAPEVGDARPDRPLGRLAILAAMAVTVAMTVDAERGPLAIAFVLLGCIYLYKGYRGTRWLFAGYLTWLALLAGAEILQRASRGMDLVVLRHTDGGLVVCVARRSTLPRPEGEGGAVVGRRTVKGRASPARRLTER